MKLPSILGLSFLIVTTANGQNQPTMPEHAYINPDYANSLLQNTPRLNKKSAHTQNKLLLQKSTATPILDIKGTIPLLPSEVNSVKSVDIDRDGIDEVVVTGTGNGHVGASISVLKYDNALTKYVLSRQKHYPTMYSANILGIWTENDGIAYALVNENGLRKINLVTLDVVVHNTLSHYSGSKFSYIDIDGDGVKDIVGIDYSYVYILDSATLASKATTYLTQSIVGIGKFDDSSDVQILTYGYDYVNNTNAISIWKIVNNTAIKIRSVAKNSNYSLANVADVNGDGFDDLIFSSYSQTTYNYTLTAEDVKTGTQLWSTPNNNSFEDIVIAKSPSDTRLYLRRWGSIDVVSGSTGVLTRTISAPYYYNTRIQLINGINPSEESLLSFGSNYNGRAFQLVNPTTGVISYGLVDHGTPAVFADWADIDNDGVKELITVQNSAINDAQNMPKITVFDAGTLAVRKSLFLPLGQSNTSGSILDATLVHGPDSSAPELWSVMYEQNGISLRGVNLTDMSIKRVDINANDYYDRRVVRASDTASEKRILVVGVNSAMLFDTGTQTVLSELSFGNNYFSNGVHISRGKNELGQTVIYLSSHQPNSYSGSQVGVITLVGNTLSLSNPIARVQQSLGKVTAMPGDGQKYLYALNDNGEIYSYHLENKEWAFFTKACAYGADAVLKPINTNELLMFCGDAGAIIDLTTGSTRWATSKIGFNVSNGRAVSLLNNGNDKKLLVGGARIVVASYLGDVKIPTAAPLSMSLHWNKTATIQLPVVNPNPDRNFNTAIVLNPGNGTLTIENSAAATVKYTPGEASLDPVTAMYLVKNDYIESAPATINITKTNSKPVAYGATITVRASQAASGKLNGNDPDNDPVTWQMQTQPTKGNVSLSADGNFSFTANAGVTGSDTFTAVLKDAVSASEPVQVVVTIEAEPKKSKGGSTPAALLLLMLSIVLGRRYKARLMTK